MSANFKEDLRKYLTVPQSYCGFLGGLSWSLQGDAIVAQGDRTFAMTLQIAEFLVGFGRNRPLIHFGHILHLLGMFEIGPSLYLAKTPLAQAFRANGRHLRNAGALAAELCRDVPVASSPPKVEDLFVVLASLQKDRRSLPGLSSRDDRQIPVPALKPEEFEERVLDALRDWSAEEIEHWLRHGRGSTDGAGRRIAEVLKAKPPTLESVLGRLTKRDRIAGALRFAPAMSGALTLPPRRGPREDTGQGGYADITTRGSFERILPSQLVLEPMELLRRLANRELLHFEPERPQTAVKEELVVLLDQGWRSWGEIRLALTAALLALGRFAGRTGRSFRIATTSWERGSYCPIETDPKTLGERLEASQIHSQPGLLLGRLIAEAGANPDSRCRDIVTLAHPFTIREPEMRDVIKAGAANPRLRLFSLTADSQGEVELAGLRGGLAVSLRRLRVDFGADGPNPEPEQKPERSQEGPSEAQGWRGAVEMIGYPFRYWLSPIPDDLHFHIDDKNERLLVAGPLGRLHMWSLDGQATAALPRAMIHGRPLTRITRVEGENDAFAVQGFTETGERGLAYYDLRLRHCTVFPWMNPDTPDFSNSSASAQAEPSKTPEMPEANLGPNNIFVRIFARLLPLLSKAGAFDSTIDIETALRSANILSLDISPKNNTIVHVVSMDLKSLSDKQRFLLVHRRVGDQMICLCDLPEPSPNPGCRLTRDGDKLARRCKNGVEVLDVRRPDQPEFITPMTPCPAPEVRITQTSLAIAVGTFGHLFVRQSRGWAYAQVSLREDGRGFTILASMGVDPQTPIVWPSSADAEADSAGARGAGGERSTDVVGYAGDPKRFQWIKAGRVNVVIDAFGQILLLSPSPSPSSSSGPSSRLRSGLASSRKPEPAPLVHLAAMRGRFEFRLPNDQQPMESWRGGVLHPGREDSEALLRQLGEALDQAFGSSRASLDQAFSIAIAIASAIGSESP